jgi:heme/copper-type cytochrome/quinol oxidase subunit 2
MALGGSQRSSRGARFFSRPQGFAYVASSLSSTMLSNLCSRASEHLGSKAVRRRNGSNAEVILELQNAQTKRKSYRGILIGLIILVLIVAGVYAYYQSAPQPQAQTETISIDIKTVTQNGVEHHIFDPGTITVHRGDHVVLTVTNRDTDHTHGITIPDLTLNTGPLAPGQSAKLEFNADTTGTFTMRCSVPGCAEDHAQMLGQLIVTQ